MPFCSVILSAKKPKNPDYPKELKPIGDHLRKRRLDLDLTQKEVAPTLEFSEATLLGWEKGWFSAQPGYLPKIIAFLGYTPAPYDVIEGNDIGENLKSYRKTHGMNRHEFAKLHSVDTKTYGTWERGGFATSRKLMERLSRLKIDLSI